MQFLRNKAVDAFFEATGADVRYIGDPAGYFQQHDYIRMPPPEAFTDAETFYATLAHEMIHWTHHPSRLARDFGRRAFGDEGHQREEVVAEIGAAYLCAELSVGTEEARHHTPYIQSWHRGLRPDFLFSAAAIARQSVDYLFSLHQRADHTRPQIRASAANNLQPE